MRISQPTGIKKQISNQMKTRDSHEGRVSKHYICKLSAKVRISEEKSKFILDFRAKQKLSL